MMLVRIGLSVAIAIAMLAMATLASAQVLGAPDPVMTQRFIQERNARVGEVLPSGTELALDDGRVVDLREHLHGPVIVLKTPIASGSQGLLEAVRESGGESLDTTKAHIAMIIVADKEHEPLNLPEAVPVFRTKSTLEDGFFGGHILPTAFYLDQDLRLIKRHPGLSMDPTTLLHFPAK